MKASLAFLLIGLGATGQTRQTSRGAALPDITSSHGRRLALVIGNDAYPENRLHNAVNDARSMKSALEDAGFTVRMSLDATQQQMEIVVDEFTSGVNPGDIALFFYAGHGMQISDQNYLIPVDFQARTAVDAKYKAYPAQRIQENLEAAGAAMQIIVLDACRNNPFRSWRGGSDGLAAMHAGRGTYIAFATAPGMTAADSPEGKNGLFTGELVTVLREPGLTIDQVFNRVREQVERKSRGQQHPWSLSEVTGEFYFKVTIEGSISVPSSTPPRDLNGERELAFWNSIKDENDMALLEEYLRTYPAGAFVSIAKAKLNRLKASAAPPTSIATETNRIADSPASSDTKSGASDRAALVEAFNKGREALRAKQYPAAVAELLRASRIDPSQHAVWGNLGDAYAGATENASAESAHRRALVLKADEPAYHCNLALLLAREQRLTEAQPELEMAAKLDPQHADRYHYNMGALLANLGMIEAGGAEFRKSAETNPSYGPAQYQYGLYLVSRAVLANGKIVAAPGTKEAFERYLELNPDEQSAGIARSMIRSLGSSVLTSWTRLPGSVPKNQTPAATAVDSKTTAARLIRKTVPAYPPLAKAARIQGTVALKAVIGSDGAIASLELVSGHPFLVTAAIDSAKDWLYSPTMFNGERVEVITQLVVNFNLQQ